MFIEKAGAFYIPALKYTQSSERTYMVSRSAFYLDSLASSSKGKGGEIEIEMKFKAGERPESVSRIVDELMNTGIVHTPEKLWEETHRKGTVTKDV